MDYLNKVIEVGGTKSVVFDGDAVTVIDDKIFFIPSKKRSFDSSEEKRKEFQNWVKDNTDEKEVNHSIPTFQRVSKEFLNTWKDLDNVTMTTTRLSAGGNTKRFEIKL